MSKIRMNLDNWTYKEYVDFVNAYQTGKMASTYDLAVKLIVDWDYDADLNGSDPMLELGVHESAEVLRTIMESISSYIEKLDTSVIKVDFTKWNTRRLLKFDEAKMTGKFELAQEMLSEVIIGSEIDFSKPLLFPDGATLYKAVNDAYAKVVSGKN